MELETVVALVVVAFSSASIVVSQGWRAGARTIGFVAVVLLIYMLVINYFGHEGKVVLAVVSVVAAMGFLYVRKLSGKSIW